MWGGVIVGRCPSCDKPRKQKPRPGTIEETDPRCALCRQRPYRAHRKDSCERCGFIPEVTAQLEVDHIDGDHNNNIPSNLMTLCANCHRLKTALQLKWGKGPNDVQWNIR